MPGHGEDIGLNGGRPCRQTLSRGGWTVQKVAASGKALATDHLSLALAFLQSNHLDEARGELTTARQMDPKQVAAAFLFAVTAPRIGC